MTEEEFNRAMGTCHLQGLDTTDKMDNWMQDNRQLLASGKVPASDVASFERMTDLVERFWLISGLMSVVEAKRDGMELSGSTKEGQEAVKQSINKNVCAFCGNSFIQKQGTTQICPECRLKANQDGIASIDPTGKERKALQQGIASFLIRWLILILVVVSLIFIWYKSG